jgi:hypothetical protein
MPSLTRRHFLAATSAALATTPFLTSAARGTTFQAAKRRINLGIQHYSLREFSVEDALKYAKDIGCSHSTRHPKRSLMLKSKSLISVLQSPRTA